MQKIIAVDLGTTLIKCTLFDESGRTLAVERLPCHLQHSKPGWAQQNAELWYAGVCDLIQSITRVHDPGEITGICISSQGISVVPVDAQFHPLMDAVSWLDLRGAEEIPSLSELFSEPEWFRRTGKFLSGSYTLPKILWLQKHHPDVAAKTWKYLLPMDYMNARMTGRAVTDHTMASGTMCYQINRGGWDPSILALTGLEEDYLPEILPSGTPVGRLNMETVQKTGLSTETIVFNGGQDQKVAAYAAGIDRDRSSLSLGTAGALEILVDDPVGQTLLPFFPHVIPGQTLVEGCVSTTGAAIQWLKDTLCPDLTFEEMNHLAASVSPGSGTLRFYPHMSKPGSPHRGLNCYGSIQGLSLGVNRGDLIRSLYEGLSFEFRQNLEYAARVGSHTRELLVFGGASKSSIFCQIIANVTGLRLHVFENGELCSIGAAKLAAGGLGWNADSFAKTAAGRTLIYEPEPELMEQYQNFYGAYIQAYER